MLCPVCHTSETKTGIYGIEPCSGCQARRSANSLPGENLEFTTESIRTGRREYFNSVIQPYRSGELSLEYLEVNGTKGIKPTQQEIDHAKPVWKDIPGWENRNNSK